MEIFTIDKFYYLCNIKNLITYLFIKLNEVEKAKIFIMKGLFSIKCGTASLHSTFNKVIFSFLRKMNTIAIYVSLEISSSDFKAEEFSIRNVESIMCNAEKVFFLMHK